MANVSLRMRVSNRIAAAGYEAGKKVTGKTNALEIIDAQQGSYLSRLFSPHVQCDAKIVRNYGLLTHYSLDVKV